MSDYRRPKAVFPQPRNTSMGRSMGAGLYIVVLLFGSHPKDGRLLRQKLALLTVHSVRWLYGRLTLRLRLFPCQTTTH